MLVLGVGFFFVPKILSFLLSQIFFLQKRIFFAHFTKSYRKMHNDKNLCTCVYHGCALFLSHDFEGSNMEFGMTYLSHIPSSFI